MRLRLIIAGLVATVALGGLVAATAGPADATAPAPTVWARGGAPLYSQIGGSLTQPVVDIAPNPKAPGYWLAAADGGVFARGSAPFYGSAGALRLNAPIVAIAATPTGHGYWLTASDGGIFTYGDARFYGSLGAIKLWQPIMSMAATPSGQGYWLAASDGGVFTFGDAHFYGSVAGHAPQGIVDFVPSRTGRGYALLASDGTLYRFGDATAAPANVTHGRAAASITTTPDGKGYWVAERTGAVDAIGTATYYGNGVHGSDVALGIARTPTGNGYWVATMPVGPPLPPGSGSGRRIVYSNSQQRVWTVEANGIVSHSWLVSGRPGLPPFGTFQIQWRRDPDPDGSLVLRYMQAFWLSPNGGWVGFHQIPQTWDGTPIEPDSLLGTPQSHGCVRMSADAALTLWGWATVGTTVVAVP